MSRENKIKILLIISYFLSLFLFELVYITLNFEREIKTMVEMNYYFPLSIITPVIQAGIYHFVIVTILAIIIKFSSKIRKEYKKIIYSFPLLTFIFTIPMFFPVGIIARQFGVFNNM